MAAILGVLAAILEPWRPSWPPFCDVIVSKPAPILLMSFLLLYTICITEKVVCLKIWVSAKSGRQLGILSMCWCQTSKRSIGYDPFVLTAGSPD